MSSPIHSGLVLNLVYAATFMLMFVSVSAQDPDPFSPQSCFDMVKFDNKYPITTVIERKTVTARCCNFIKTANEGRSQQNAEQKNESSGHLCYALKQEAANGGSGLTDKGLADFIIRKCPQDNFSALLENTDCSNSTSSGEVPGPEPGIVPIPTCIPVDSFNLDSCFASTTINRFTGTPGELEQLSTECCNFAMLRRVYSSTKTAPERRKLADELCLALKEEANKRKTGSPKGVAVRIEGRCNGFKTLLKDTQCDFYPLY